MAAHQPARAVRGGAVPVLVALSDANQAAVPHIDGDDQAFASAGGNRALAQNHGVGIDVVMNGGKVFPHRETQAPDDFIHNGLAVEKGEALGQLHIVDIVVKQRPLHIGQLRRDRAGRPAGFDLPDPALDLLEPPCRLQRGD